MNGTNNKRGLSVLQGTTVLRDKTKEGTGVVDLVTDCVEDSLCWLFIHRPTEGRRSQTEKGSPSPTPPRKSVQNHPTRPTFTSLQCGGPSSESVVVEPTFTGSRERESIRNDSVCKV